jgi:hypothetical protein
MPRMFPPVRRPVGKRTAWSTPRTAFPSFSLQKPYP